MPPSSDRSTASPPTSVTRTLSAGRKRVSGRLDEVVIAFAVRYPPAGPGDVRPADTRTPSGELHRHEDAQVTHLVGGALGHGPQDTRLQWIADLERDALLIDDR